MTSSPNNRQAIVFLHGFSDQRGGAWRRFPEFVGKNRSDWDVYTLRYETSFGPDILGIWAADPELPVVAGQFRTQMGSEPIARYERIAIAAHSMGGLVAQRAVADDPILRAKLAHLFLFGTPSAGLIKASLVRWWKRQFDNMAIDGDFIKSLRADWSARITDTPSFCLHVVAGAKDQFVPTYTSTDPFPERFRRFVPGNHLEMVRALTPDHAAVRLVITALPLNCLNQQLAGEQLPAAMEEFGAAPLLRRLATLPQNPEPQAVTKLALDLDGAGKRHDAIELLLRFKDLHPDIMGTLAGRYKRMWIENRGREFADKALNLYADAFDLVKSKAEVDAAQAYYLAINVAFLALVFCENHENAKQWAAVALHYCDVASKESKPYWLVATMGEANLYLGDYDAAIRHYHEAQRILGPEDNWQLQSTWYHAACISSYLRDVVLADSLEKCFAVVEQA